MGRVPERSSGNELGFLAHTTFPYVLHRFQKFPKKAFGNPKYGTDIVEMEVDSICENDKIVIIDDLIATGGTMKAAEKLVSQTPGELLGCFCLIEIDFFNGKKDINAPFVSLIHVD